MTWKSEATKAAYFERNRAKINARSQAWREKNRPLHRKLVFASQVKRLYGITVDEYEKRLADQDGKCFVCKSPPTGKHSNAKLHLDHCHTTGKIRKFLCGNCNATLGMAKDSSERLIALVQYLKDHADA